MYEEWLDDEDDELGQCEKCGRETERTYCNRCWSQSKCSSCGASVRPMHELCRACETAKKREALRQCGKLIPCVLCGSEIGSEYLAEALRDHRVYIMAAHVTHYRHDHVRYYDNSVGYVARHHDYDYLKHIVNERAKRQIIRKGFVKLRELGIRADHVAALQGTTEETMKVAHKFLDD